MQLQPHELIKLLAETDKRTAEAIIAKMKQEEKERKTIEATNAIREVLSINRVRLVMLLQDVSDGYYCSTITEREILKDCLKLALIMKEAESIEIKF